METKKSNFLNGFTARKGLTGLAALVSLLMQPEMQDAVQKSIDQAQETNFSMEYAEEEPDFSMEFDEEQDFSIFGASYVKTNGKLWSDEETLDHMLNARYIGADSRILRALAQKETRSYFNVNCSEKSACGLFQLTPSGARAGLVILYTHNPMYTRIQADYKDLFTEKKRTIGDFAGNYFSLLENLSDAVESRHEQIDGKKSRLKDWLKSGDYPAGWQEMLSDNILRLQKEEITLKRINIAINGGFLGKDSSSLLSKLYIPPSYQNFNSYISHLVGIESDWHSFLKEQPKQVDDAVKMSRDSAYPELNALLGDIHILYYMDFFSRSGSPELRSRPLAHTIQAYSEGLGDYLKRRKEGRKTTQSYEKFAFFYRKINGVEPSQFLPTREKVASLPQRGYNLRQ